jgi:hypothetical protein
MSNIYKKLKKLDSREPNNPIKNWDTKLNKEFSTEEYQMAILTDYIKLKKENQSVDTSVLLGRGSKIPMGRVTETKS